MVIKVIPGADDVLADLLSRWGSPTEVKCLHTKLREAKEQKEGEEFMTKRVFFLHPAAIEEPYIVKPADIRRYQEHEWMNRPCHGDYDAAHTYRDTKNNVRNS